MLDTRREVVTPEGVALRLPAAGPVPRALAWAIDFAIRFAVLSVLGVVLALLGTGGQGLYLVALFAVFWLYPVVFEAAWRGQTPGKRALGLRVVAANGAPVGWLAAITRSYMRRVAGQRRQTAHGRACKTCGDRITQFAQISTLQI